MGSGLDCDDAAALFRQLGVVVVLVVGLFPNFDPVLLPNIVIDLHYQGTLSVKTIKTVTART
jgi:hypothetical protein